MVVSSSIIVFLLQVTCLFPSLTRADTFECTGEGYFPDPKDCTLYHVCMYFENADPEYMSIADEHCESGWAYDPVTTTCKYQTTDSVCTQGIVPDCEYAGQNGVLKTDSMMFYICDDNLQIKIYECPHGETYVAGSGCSTAATTTTTTTTQATHTTTLRPITDGCSTPGVFADPDNCYKYYICTDWLERRHGACFLGFYYNTERHKCMLGFC